MSQYAPVVSFSNNDTGKYKVEVKFEPIYLNFTTYGLYVGGITERDLVKTEIFLYTSLEDPFCVEYLMFDVGWFEKENPHAHCQTTLASAGCSLLWTTNENVTFGFLENLHTLFCVGLKGKPFHVSSASNKDWSVVYKIPSLTYYHTNTPLLVIKKHGYQVLSPMAVSMGLIFDTRKHEYSGYMLSTRRAHFYPHSAFVIGMGLTLDLALSHPSVRLTGGKLRYQSLTCSVNPSYTPPNIITYCPCKTILGPAVSRINAYGGCSPEYELLNGPCNCIVKLTDLEMYTDNSVYVVNQHHGTVWYIFHWLLSLIQLLIAYISSLISVSMLQRCVIAGPVYAVGLKVFNNQYMAFALSLGFSLWM